VNKAEMAAVRYLTDVQQETCEPMEREVEPPQHNFVDIDSQTVDEAIKNLPPELCEKIYNEFVSTKIRERKEMGWNEVHNGIERLIKIRERKEMGWNKVHNHIEGAPFFDCDNFYYTDDYLSNFDQEEIYNLDTEVLHQLLVQPSNEEEQPQNNLVDVESQNMSLQEEIEENDPEDLLVDVDSQNMSLQEEIEENDPEDLLVDDNSQNMSLQEEIDENDPEDLLHVMVNYLMTKPEDLVEEEEELKRDYPAIMGQITKNKHAILPLCRKLLRMTF